MSIVKSKPIEKYINRNYIQTSEIVVLSEPEYSTYGESYLIVKDIPSSKIVLNSSTTDHITIKSLTKILIIPNIGLIDDEYEEIIVGKGACIEFFFALGTWYILSSDGLKMD